MTKELESELHHSKQWDEKTILERMSERPDTIISLGVSVECLLILIGHIMGGW